MNIAASRLRPLLAHLRRVATDRRDKCTLSAAGGELRLEAGDLCVRLVLRAPCAGDLAPVACDLRALSKAVEGKGEVSLTLGTRAADDIRQCSTSHSTMDLICYKSVRHEGPHGAYDYAAHKSVEWDCLSVALPPLPDVPVLQVELCGDVDLVDAESVTLVPEPIVEKPKDVPVAALSATLDFLAPAVSDTCSMENLRGVWLDGARAYALDGHVLHVDDSRDRVLTRGPVLVPYTAARSLRALLDDCGAKSVFLAVERKRKTPGGESRWSLVLKHGAWADLFATWDVVPSPIDRIIPPRDPAAFRARVGAEALAAVVDRVGGPREKYPRADQGYRPRVVRIAVGAGVAVSRDREDLGEMVREEVACLTEGSSLMFGMNADLFLGCLRGFAGEVEVSRSNDDLLGPVRVDGGKRFAVCMPCRL